MTNRRMDLLSILTVTVLVLVLMAVISPYNGATLDDWAFPLYGDQRLLTVPGSGRDFGILPVLVGELLLPGRLPAAMFAQQVVFMILTAWGLYYLMRRIFPGSRFYALLYAIIWCLVNPTEQEIGMTMSAGAVYTFVTLLCVMTIIALLEFWLQKGRQAWAFLLVALVLGYITVRAYEAFIAPMFALPVLILLLVRGRSPRSRAARVGAALLWYVMISASASQFLLPLLTGSARVTYQVTYQNLMRGDPLNYVRGIITLYESAFVPVSLLSLLVGIPYLVPSLAIAALTVGSVHTVWRSFPQDRHPIPTRQLAVCVLVGLAWIGLAGAAYVYGNLGWLPRAQFFAEPGQALVIFALMVGAARVLARKRSPLPYLLLFMAITAVYGGINHHWAQFVGIEHRARTFAESTGFFRQVTALAPGVRANTLMIYLCDDPGLYHFDDIDALAVRYLYQADIHMAPLGDLAFAPDSVTFTYNIEFLNFGSRNYGYDDIIVFGCDDERITLYDVFPPGLAPEGAQTNIYAPYALIEQGLITGKQARALGM